jgi:hypothetical protein
MSRLSVPTWSKIAGVGVPATGASWLMSHVGLPPTTEVIISALLAVSSIAAAAAVALPRIVESIQKRKADMLKAKADLITAESEARSLERRTETEDQLSKLGMESQEKADLAERMFWARALSSDRPEGRRLSDEILDRQLTTAEKSIISRLSIPKEGTSGPPGYYSAPADESGGHGVVVPFSPADDLSECRRPAVGGELGGVLAGLCDKRGMRPPPVPGRCNSPNPTANTPARFLITYWP